MSLNAFTEEPASSSFSEKKTSPGRRTMYRHLSFSRVFPLRISYQIRPSVLSVRNSTTYRGVKNWLRNASSYELRGAWLSLRAWSRSSFGVKYW